MVGYKDIYKIDAVVHDVLLQEVWKAGESYLFIYFKLQFDKNSIMIHSMSNNNFKGHFNF
jgi:hypothetical protein